MIRTFFICVLLLANAGCAPGSCDGIPGERTANAWPGWAAPAHYRYPDFTVPADLTVLADMTVPADLTVLGDMASASITILQAQAITTSGPTGTLNWFTPNSNLTPGSTLVIGSWNDDASNSETSVSDATNGAWPHKDAIDGTGSSVGWLYWFGKPNNTSSGQPQVTVTTTLNYGKHSGVFIEIGNANTSTPFGTYATYTTSYGDPIFTGSLTTSTRDAILGFAINPGKNSGLGSAGANTGYTLVNFSGDMDFTGLLYRVATAGTYNPGYVSTLNAFFGTSINIKP